MISKLSKRFYIFDREQNLEIYQDITVFSEETIANENWFQKVLAIELIIVRMMSFEIIKKKKNIFSKT
jgi:hypothetical protein